MNGLIGYLLSKKYVDSKEAPKDGKQYGRQDGDWTEVTGGGGGNVAVITGEMSVIDGQSVITNLSHSFEECKALVNDGKTVIVQSLYEDSESDTSSTMNFIVSTMVDALGFGQIVISALSGNMFPSPASTLNIGFWTEEETSIYMFTNTPEDSVNKVTTISDSSTDMQYPSAKAVYNAIEQGGGGSGGGTFLIKVTKSRTSYNSDKTFAEIESAIENGLTPIVHYVLSDDDYYYLSAYSSGYYAVFNNIRDVDDGFFVIQAIIIRQNSSGVTSAEWHEYEYSF